MWSAGPLTNSGTFRRYSDWSRGDTAHTNDGELDMRFNLAAIGAAAAILTATLATPQAAQARFYAPGMSVPDLAEPVACRRVTSRVVRPGGGVVVRHRTVCDRRPAFAGPRCRVVRERVVRPNGAVVFRTNRICR